MLHINDLIRYAPDGAGTGGGEGQDPPPAANPTPGQASGGRDYESEIAKLREENAKWRTDLRAAQTQLSELTPAAQRLQELEEANKTEAQKQAERLARLEAELTASKAAAELATKRSRLTVLATKAGVSPDVVDYLDASKFDLDNEETALKALQALAASKQPAGGSPSNPGRNGGDGAPDAKSWYEQVTGKRTSIFGG